MGIIVVIKSLNCVHGKTPIMYVCIKDSITFYWTEKQMTLWNLRKCLYLPEKII